MATDPNQGPRLSESPISRSVIRTAFDGLNICIREHWVASTLTPSFFGFPQPIVVTPAILT